MTRLSGLIYYPIKSCRGTSVESCTVEPMGLEHDRRMMVINDHGRFLTQREHPRLALVAPKLSDDRLTLAAPAYDALQVELRKTGAIVPVRIWKDRGVQSVDQGDQAAHWLSDWLGSHVRLVRIAEGASRQLDPNYAAKAGDQTGFADGYPILIISQASLQDLNSRLNAPVGMDRFRPNIVVSGCGPYAEDEWRRVTIGDVQLAVVKPCPRCVVTTIDKESLARDREPLRTLRSYRRQGGGAMFGQNAVPLGPGRLEVGTAVHIMEQRP
jgi:hypothetical protein